MAKLALTFYSLLDIPIKDVVECYQAAEKSGFTYGVMSESAGRDAMVILTSAVAKTKTLKFGTNIIPIYVRSPMQTAASALTLHEVSDGRFQLLGLGTSYQKRVEPWFGIKFEKPAVRSREYIEILRMLMGGSPGNYSGQFYQLKDYPALTEKPNQIPIYLGVTGPRMRILTGRVANGVILNSLSTPQFVRDSIKLIEQGAQEAGRRIQDVEIGCSIVLSASKNRSEALEAAKRGIMFYIIYPEFDPIVQTTPYMKEIQALRDAYWSGDVRKAYSILTEDIVSAFVVFGTPEECRKKLELYREAGVELMVIRSCVDKLNGKKAVLENIDALAGYR
jgi:5,10-methylenetetrahydromethanopterin reductase